MPFVSLLELFNGEEAWVRSGGKDGKGTARRITYLFPYEPEVRFGKYMDGKFCDYGNNYNDFPSVELTEAQVLAADSRWADICKKNPSAFNGRHVLITDLSYDPSENVVRACVARCDYKTLGYIQSKYTSEFSGLFHRTGTLSPVITSDKCTFLMERTVDKWWSVPSGFLEPDEETDAVCVKANAEKELREELFSGNLDTKAEDERVTDKGALKLSGVSIRGTVGYMPAVEWVLPVSVNNTYDEMAERVKNNTAKDAHEHTGRITRCPLADFESLPEGGEEGQEVEPMITASDVFEAPATSRADILIVCPIVTAGFFYARGLIGKADQEVPEESSANISNEIRGCFGDDMPDGVIVLSRETQATTPCPVTGCHDI